MRRLIRTALLSLFASAVCHAPTSAAAATIYFNDFESGLNGFVLDNGANGLWHLTGNVPYSGAAALGYVTDETSPSAILNGNFMTGGPGSPTANAGTAYSPAVLLPSSAQITVSFQSIVRTENFDDYDNLRAMVNTAQTLAGATLLGSTATNTIIEGTTYNLHSFDLSAFSGQTIYLAFNFATGDAIENDYAGIRLDDVTVTAEVVPEPASLLLIGAGLLAGARRFRRSGCGTRRR